MAAPRRTARQEGSSSSTARSPRDRREWRDGRAEPRYVPALFAHDKNGALIGKVIREGVPTRECRRFR